MQEAPCYRIIAFQKIKMSQFVLPGDTVRTEITIKEQSSNLLILQLKSEVQTKRVCIVEIVIEMKEPWCMQ
jgi:3-hydroxymyristoyl/3-hydroxydecanoyl-(acyl carrier protein) dehydratase